MPGVKKLRPNRSHKSPPMIRRRPPLLHQPQDIGGVVRRRLTLPLRLLAQNVLRIKQEQFREVPRGRRGKNPPPKPRLKKHRQAANVVNMSVSDKKRVNMLRLIRKILKVKMLAVPAPLKKPAINQDL